MHCENIFITEDIVLKKSSFQKIFSPKENKTSSTQKGLQKPVYKNGMFFQTKESIAYYEGSAKRSTEMHYFCCYTKKNDFF